MKVPKETYRKNTSIRNKGLNTLNSIKLKGEKNKCL